MEKECIVNYKPKAVLYDLKVILSSTVRIFLPGPGNYHPTFPSWKELKNLLI